MTGFEGKSEMSMIALIALLQTSGMTLTEKPDPITDRPTVTVEASSGGSRLSIRCVVGKKLEVIFSTADHYLQRERHLAEWKSRVDGNPAKDTVWDIDDPRTAEIDKSGSARNFVNSLLGGSALRMRVNIDAPFDLVFDIRGSTQALNRVLSICK
jgi:hypothetical protein